MKGTVFVSQIPLPNCHGASRQGSPARTLRHEIELRTCGYFEISARRGRTHRSALSARDEWSTGGPSSTNGRALAPAAVHHRRPEARAIECCVAEWLNLSPICSPMRSEADIRSYRFFRHAAGSDRPARPPTDSHEPSQHPWAFSPPGNCAAGYNAAALSFIIGATFFAKAIGVCRRSSQCAAARQKAWDGNRAVPPSHNVLAGAIIHAKPSLTIVPSPA